MVLYSLLVAALWLFKHDVATPDLAATEQYNIVRYLRGAGPYVEYQGVGISPEVPEHCELEQVQLVMRHAERFPVESSGRQYKELVERLQKYPHGLKGGLSFLNDYTYFVSDEKEYGMITTPSNAAGPYWGSETARRAGKSFRDKYGCLYDNETVVLYGTSSDRVHDTAQYFAQGFLGKEYGPKKVKYRNISEDSSRGFNSLTPRFGCKNYNQSAYADKTRQYPDTYKQRIVERLKASNPGLNISKQDVGKLFDMCAYEINVRGQSQFCSLFNHNEFVEYGHHTDIEYYYKSGPGHEMAAEIGNVFVEASKKLLQQNKTRIVLSFTHDADIEMYHCALGLLDLGRGGRDLTLGPTAGPRTSSQRTWDPTSGPTFFNTYHHVDRVPMGGRIIIEKYKCGKTSYIRHLVNGAVVPVEGCNGPGFACEHTQNTDKEIIAPFDQGRGRAPHKCSISGDKEINFYE